MSSPVGGKKRRGKAWMLEVVEHVARAIELSANFSHGESRREAIACSGTTTKLEHEMLQEVAAELETRDTGADGGVVELGQRPGLIIATKHANRDPLGENAFGIHRDAAANTVGTEGRQAGVYVAEVAIEAEREAADATHPQELQTSLNAGRELAGLQRVELEAGADVDLQRLGLLDRGDVSRGGLGGGSGFGSRGGSGDLDRAAVELGVIGGNTSNFRAGILLIDDAVLIAIRVRATFVGDRTGDRRALVVLVEQAVMVRIRVRAAVVLGRADDGGALVETVAYAVVVGITIGDLGDFFRRVVEDGAVVLLTGRNVHPQRASILIERPEAYTRHAKRGAFGCKAALALECLDRSTGAVREGVEDGWNMPVGSLTLLRIRQLARTEADDRRLADCSPHLDRRGERHRLSPFQGDDDGLPVDLDDGYGCRQRRSDDGGRGRDSGVIGRGAGILERVRRGRKTGKGNENRETQGMHEILH